MKRIGAREANQSFSKLLREVEAGQEFVITRNDRPVARLGPANDAPVMTEAERDEAARRMQTLLDSFSVDLRGRRFTREDMNER